MSTVASLRRAAIVASVVLAATMVAFGLARTEVQTGLDSFLPEDRASLQGYQEFADSFGSEPVVVMLRSEGDQPALTTDRMADVLRLEGELSRLPGVASVHGPGTLLNQIARQANQLLAELMGRRDAEVSLAEAKAREAGADKAEVEQAGKDARTRFDARYGPLLIAGMEGGLPTLGNQRFIDTVVYDEGAPRAQWRLVVPRPDVAAIMVRPDSGLDAGETQQLLDRVDEVVGDHQPAGTDVTVTGTPVIVTALADRAIADAPRLASLAIGGLALCFLAALWLRPRRRLVPLAVTVTALATSLAVFGWLDRPLTLGMVAFSTVLLGIGSYYPTYFLTGAARRTVSVVAAASAASLATLSLSPLPLVRDIGLLMAVGVTVVLGLSLLLSRTLLRDGVVPEAALDPPRDPRGGAAAPRLLLAVMTLVAAWGWCLLPGLEVSSDVDHFAGGLAELQDARWAEDVLGSGGEIDLVVSGPDTTSPEALAWMSRAGEHITLEHGDVVRTGLSPATLVSFLGPDPTAEQIDAAFRLLPDYLTGTVVTEDRSTAVLSYGVRLDDIDELADLRKRLMADLPPPPAGYDVDLVGLPLVLADGQELVSGDRWAASLIGIAVAGLILVLGLRHRADAGRAGLAAAIATGVGFWLLDVIGRGLDPVTLSLGALTIAVGAEFTVVRAEAARQRSRVLTRTLALVAATSAIGYLVLLASGLHAVRDFGLELAVSVLLAFVASVAVAGATVVTGRGGPGEAGDITIGHTERPTNELEAAHA